MEKKNLCRFYNRSKRQGYLTDMNQWNHKVAKSSKRQFRTKETRLFRRVRIFKEITEKDVVLI